MHDLSDIYKKHKGEWVAVREDTVEVVGSGETVEEALQEAEEKGVKNSSLLKVPKKTGTKII